MSKFFYNPVLLIMPALLFGFLAGCSSSDGGDVIGGIEGTGDTLIASGTVTQFGSVYVNGIHFNTDNASIELNGEVVDEQTLNIGMVVTVTGTVDDNGTEGVATNIVVDHLITGQVQAVSAQDSQRKIFTVLGQTIAADEEALFNNTSFTNITEGQWLSISGLYASADSITATYIEQVVQTSSDIEGAITRVDTDASTLTINALTVNYAAAQLIDGNTSELAVGTLIEVKGTLNEQTGVLQAAQIIFKPLYQPAAEVALEGLVTLINGELVVTVNGAPISIGTPSAIPEALTEGARVIVRGRYTNNILVADTVTAIPQSVGYFIGSITSVDTNQAQLVSYDTTFHAHGFTAFVDATEQPERYFNLSSLRTGETVKIFAAEENDRWVATQVRRESNNLPPQTLQGAITRIISDTEFELAGLIVKATFVNEEIRQQLATGVEIRMTGIAIGNDRFNAYRIDIQQ